MFKEAAYLLVLMVIVVASLQEQIGWLEQGSLAAEALRECLMEEVL